MKKVELSSEEKRALKKEQIANFTRFAVAVAMQDNYIPYFDTLFGDKDDHKNASSGR